MLLSEKIEQSIDIETSESACGGLVEDLDFQVVVPESVAASEQSNATLSLETISQLDADLVIIEGYNSDIDSLTDDPISHQMEGVKQQWEDNAIAQSMPASKEDRVYFTTTYLCHGLLGPIGTDIFISQLEEQ